MIICFKCSSETKKMLDNLLASEDYADYSEAICAAVANLAALHQELGDASSMVIDGHDRQPGAPGAPEIPEMFRLDGLERPRSLAPMPDDPWDEEDVVPPEAWIFGQYNRLLPAKANCRAVAYLLQAQPNGVPLKDAAEKIAQEAGVFGEVLAWRDEQNGLGRDHKLAIAFPRTGSDGAKGRLRYADQFVGYVDGKNRMQGLLYDYKLVNWTAGEKPMVLLTEAGWNFASLPNPILDGDQQEPTERFMAEEIEFLLEHVRTSVPAERFAFRAVLTAISEGKNTPDELDWVLERYIPPEAKRRFSESFFSLQRSGAICRMLELGLVRRAREGVRVSYVLGSETERFVYVSENARGGQL